MKACYNGHTTVVQALLADARVEINLQTEVNYLAIPANCDDDVVVVEGVPELLICCE